ncbi:4a-hydroxytetrahydrobiopterin dehydratase [Bacillus shivajii]|uniref:4a-hydroxytetrahydrobiopterin dehydratase n=1 Tax=Bacillus shivajii TaxID=1983719 RepID=UPI001CFC2D39|nr:4a-hydroxytetrahydrobiopterin dehydratase [Bacillus shivajii]UCZ52041.1 4a-hydroxytetrahydrobiopterin dehydratase [Bacillus shivajii]
MILTEDQVQASLSDSKGWVLENDTWMKKEFRFPTFYKAMQFVNEIAKLAEDRQHHPYLTIDHTQVLVKLSTLDAGGLTQKDFESAHAYDLTYEKY